jgi:hypothetical protein
VRPGTAGEAEKAARVLLGTSRTYSHDTLDTRTWKELLSR